MRGGVVAASRHQAAESLHNPLQARQSYVDDFARNPQAVEAESFGRTGQSVSG